MTRTWANWAIDDPHGAADWYWLEPRAQALYEKRREIEAWCDAEFGDRRLEQRWFPFGREYAIRDPNDVVAFLIRWG